MKLIDTDTAMMIAAGALAAVTTLAAAALLLDSTGCAVNAHARPMVTGASTHLLRPPPAMPIAIHLFDATESEQRAVERAKSYWECALGVDVFSVVGPKTRVLVTRSRRGRSQAHALMRPVTTGDDRLTVALIEMHPRLRDAPIAWVESIMRHELGHVLGLPHGDGVMRRHWPTHVRRMIRHPIDATGRQIRAIIDAIPDDYHRQRGIECAEQEVK